MDKFMKDFGKASYKETPYPVAMDKNPFSCLSIKKILSI